MFVVTNRIAVGKGFAEKVVPRFAKGGKIEQLEGFRKVEVWRIDSTDDTEDMYVNTWWDSEGNFKTWTQSDAFKETHKNTGKSSTGGSPVVTSKIVRANVLSTLE